MIQFVEATELIHELADDDELKDAVVTLAVHAGIAASDDLSSSTGLLLGRRRAP